MLWRPLKAADAIAFGHPGGGCMAVCARKQSASKAARCCHGFGVFASGGAWVGTSLCGVALLVIGSFILLFAALIFSAASVKKSVTLNRRNPGLVKGFLVQTWVKNKVADCFFADSE